MRVLIVALLCGLVWSCGDDSEPACASPADCESGQSCINGRCVLRDEDAGGVDGGDDEDAGEDGGQDVGVDAPVDVGMDVADASMADTIDAPPDAGPVCPLPAVPRAEPVVLYTFEAPDDATNITDRAAADPDVPLVANTGVFTVNNDDGGSVLFAAGQLSATQEASDELVTEIRAAGSFTVEVWATPENLALEDESSPPERLVTLGESHVNQAFVLGQHDADIQARTRTDQTQASGFACDEPEPAPRAAVYAPGLAVGSPQHIVLVFDSDLGEPRVYVDGVVSGTDYPCGSGALDWMTGLYRLALGDALAGNRQWEGVIHRVAIYARAMDADEVDCWLGAGPDELPR